MGCVGVAGIEGLRQAVSRVAVVVFVESQASTVIVEGRLDVRTVMRIDNLTLRAVLQFDFDSIVVALVYVLAQARVALREQDLRQFVHGVG